MQISLKNINPETAGKILASGEARSVLGIVPSAARTGPGKTATQGITAGRVIIAILTGIAALFGSMVGLGVAVDYKVPDSVIAICFFIALVAIPICMTNWTRTGNLFRHSIRIEAEAEKAEALRKVIQSRPLRAEELQGLGKIKAFTAVQNQYLSALGALLQLHQRGQIDESRSAALFTHLNGLLISENELQAQQAAVDSLRQREQLEKIEAEEKELQARLETVRDPEARRSLEQSLTMCQARLTGLTDLLPLSERLAAQRTAVEQTLAALETSLNRMQFTTANVSSFNPDSLNIEGIQQSVADIQRESRATEQAVQEVIALRTF